MKYTTNTPMGNKIHQQWSCTHVTLQLYEGLRNYLPKEDAAAVLVAHQVCFPRSSPAGVERVVYLARKLLPKEQIGFHNIEEYYPHVRREVICTMVEQEKGYALLLAGALELAANDAAQLAHQGILTRQAP